MPKVKENCQFDTFAWLIYSQVEKYINEHIEEYEAWLQTQKNEKVVKAIED